MGRSAGTATGTANSVQLVQLASEHPLVWLVMVCSRFCRRAAEVVLQRRSGPPSGQPAEQRGAVHCAPSGGLPVTLCITPIIAAGQAHAAQPAQAACEPLLSPLGLAAEATLQRGHLQQAPRQSTQLHCCTGCVCRFRSHAQLSLEQCANLKWWAKSGHARLSYRETEQQSEPTV